MRIRGFSLVAAVAAVLAAIVGTTTAGTASATPIPVTFNFFSGIPGELAHHGGSLPGSNDFSCRPTPKHPYPVVLAHGTGGSQQTNWGAYVPLLKNEGYCVFALTYGALDDLPWPGPAVGGMGLIEDSAAQFARFVDKVLAATGASKVDVVGHSQGTVVPAYYAKVLGGRGKIDKQVSIAPAWRGSKVAGADQLLPTVRRLGISAAQTPICQGCAELDPTSEVMRIIAAGGYYYPEITYTNIATRYDEAVVPYTLGLPPGGHNVHNIVVQDGCPADLTEHAGIAGSRRAAFFVLNALDPANPRPVPCDRAAPFSGSAY